MRHAASKLQRCGARSCCWAPVWVWLAPILPSQVRAQRNLDWLRQQQADANRALTEAQDRSELLLARLQLSGLAGVLDDVQLQR